MIDYAIGDLQGCYEPFMRLLESIHFDPHQDRLWLVGDLVNRGPDSLKVLRFIKNLPLRPYITLGNHDLHLLAQIFLPHQPPKPDDTLGAILNADDKESIGHWLRQQAILHHDASLNCVMTHAGILPNWTLSDAKKHAAQLEAALQGEDFLNFLAHMYGNSPSIDAPHSPPIEQLRFICNAFTRMRFCSTNGGLELTVKTAPKDAPKGIYPWYALPTRKAIDADIIFGHWAALQGACPISRIHAIDTGCVWGGHLTALRLQDKRRFRV